MTRDDANLPSRRVLLGSAGAALAVPLVGDQLSAEQTVAPTRLLASLADLSRPVGAEGVGTRRGSLAAVVASLPLSAQNYGVVGDGLTDDTRAVQAFLDLCAQMGGRIANFGALTVHITGPLRSRGVGIVFEPASYGGARVPGFVASGSGYTALTVQGSVADFCVTLTGAGTMDIPEDGRIAGDRRPKINGIAFGSDDEPFALSTVRSVRVNNLAGFGIRHMQCWDSTFLSVSVERCGREGLYAFEVAGDTRRTCNETTWARVHVEQAVGGAIRVDPGALSCSFLKIHSERAIAREGIPTWVLGGSCTYDSVRLSAMNPAEAVLAVIGNQTEFRNLRAEGGLHVTVDASGGSVNFNNPGAVLLPAPNQNGLINIVGGVVSVLGMGGGWNLTGCRVNRLEVGFMSPGVYSTLTGCSVAELVPQRGSDQGEIVLNATRVENSTISGSGRLRGVHLLNNSRLTASGGTLACVDQFMNVDASSRIEGNVVLQRVILRLAGTVTGNLTIRGPVHDARASDNAVVGGTVTGWGPPTAPAAPGAWSVNLATSGGERTKEEHRPVIGWRFAAGAWRAVRMDIEG